MKKIVFLLTLILGYSSFFAQDVAKIKQKIEKSDQEIADAKKNIKAKTWENRAILFVEAYNVNISSLNFGIKAAQDTKNALDLYNVEAFYGKPQKRELSEDGMEIWKYQNFDVYVDKGVVFKWKDLNEVDPNALYKASEAYQKAVEVDKQYDKGKYLTKSSTKENLKMLRNALIQKATNHYYWDENAEAAKSYETAIAIYEMEGVIDTTFDKGLIYHFAGECAYNAQDYDKAITLMNNSIKAKHQFAGKSYNFVYLAYLSKNDTITALKTAEAGFQAYPNEEQNLYNIINVYLEQQKASKAEEYIDLAISKYPENFNLFFVKSNIYSKQYNYHRGEYLKLLDKADSLKKKAFRERNNKKEADRINAEKTDVIEKAKQERALIMNNFTKVIDLCRKAIEINPKYFEASYNIGFMYYDLSELCRSESNFINPTDDPEGKLAEAKNNEINQNLELSAENFEKAHEIIPTDKDVLGNLKVVYYKLQKLDRYKEVKTKLENL